MSRLSTSTVLCKVCGAATAGVAIAKETAAALMSVFMDDVKLNVDVTLVMVYLLMILGIGILGRSKIALDGFGKV
jgi:TRAP-type C4-dicarboxylate transport system permease large subunit